MPTTELPGTDGLLPPERDLLVRAQTNLGIMVAGQDLRDLVNALRSLGRLRRGRLEDLLRDIEKAAVDG